MDKPSLAQANGAASTGSLHAEQIEKRKIENVSEKKPRSVMRSFIESGEEFTWPPEVGKMEKGRCIFNPHIQGIPLDWKRKISMTSNSSIDEYTTNPRSYPYKFKKPFIVKQPRSNIGGKSRDEFAGEIEAMTGLRHPHIAVFLSAFQHQDLLYILIYPVARCDLDQFMRCMSMDVAGQEYSSGAIKKIIARSDTVDSSDNITTSSAKCIDPDSPASFKVFGPQRGPRSDLWPLDISLAEKEFFLRRYFVCLCQALSYLHESDIRHKDIKPGNILIDDSGNAVLTDFGISRRFPPHASHVTRNERKYTWEYASPEMMHVPDSERDDPSDVFSLGCVFLEMISLLLGRDLKSLRQHCSQKASATPKDWAYHLCSDSIQSWCEKLKVLCGTQTGDDDSIEARFCTTDPDTMVQILAIISKMLDVNPSNRPKSRYPQELLEPSRQPDLWKHFRSINPAYCEDCDFRSRDPFKPPEKQLDGSRRSPPPSVPGYFGTTVVIPEEFHVGANGDLISSRPSSPKASTSKALVRYSHAALSSPHLKVEVSTDQKEEPSSDILPVSPINLAPERSRSPSLSSLDPHTQVIAWDAEAQRPYRTSYGVIESQNPRDYPLPRTHQKFQILVDKKAGIIANVDLGQLGWIMRARRLLFGSFDKIYVIKCGRGSE